MSTSSAKHLCHCYDLASNKSPVSRYHGRSGSSGVAGQPVKLWPKILSFAMVGIFWAARYRKFLLSIYASNGRRLVDSQLDPPLIRLITLQALKLAVSRTSALNRGGVCWRNYVFLAPYSLGLSGPRAPASHRHIEFHKAR